ncbi:MAG: hypothetical protein GC159_12380 [Phycisphaera sp.]|nr:hypothetical protein [Phycisphaera sp.]
MSDQSKQHDDASMAALTAKIEAYYDGLLDGAGVEALEAELRSDPAAMRHYLAWMSLHSELSWTHRATDESESVMHQMVSSTSGGSSAAAGHDAAEASTANLSRTSAAWWRGAAAVAAAAAIATGVWMSVNHTMTGPTGLDEYAATAPDGPAVATLTDSADAVWAADSSVHDMLDPGAGVPAGPVRLQSGSAQMIFNSGAVVTLLGPTQMTMTGPNTCRLERGALMAFVPKRAHGFKVDTPDATITDLGTEFGVRVSDAGVSELHVFEGRVQATPRGTIGGTTHKAPAAVRFDGPNTPTAIDAMSKADFRDELGVTLPFRYAHWSFDEVSPGDLAAGDGHGFNTDALTAKLTHVGGDASASTAVGLSEGRFGKALELDGAGDYAVTKFEGVGADTPRTVAMWVRVPKDWSTNEGFSMVHWGLHEPGGAWQVSVNPRSQDGPVGRLRIGINGGQAVGATDLRDGKWHHVAVVFLGGVKSNIATHTRLYVDGRLDALGAAVSEPVNTDLGVTGKYHPVTFGRNISGGVGNQFGFRGSIDEVYIFDTALSRRQIEHLMTDNLPPEQPR